MKPISTIRASIVGACSFLAAAVPMLALAATTAVIQNPLKWNSIPDLVANLLGYVVKIGGVVAIFAFIYSGFKFVAARGNEKGLEDAKRIFYYTCIGVAVLLGAQLIATIIVGTIQNIQA